MIKNLVIDNIALIEHVDIDFREGLTVLTGETGSGKSIIIDSLAFVLGDRADKTLIKHGCEFAAVSALFEVEPNSPVLAKMREYGFGDDCEILITRKMSLAGKNEIRIQGKVATLAILKEVCSNLVDIFGQGQHLALMDVKNQLSVLDAFCNFDGCDSQLVELYSKYQAVCTEMKAFGGSDAERARLIDILKFQIDELENANLDEEEENELIATHKRLVNIEKITSAISNAVALLATDGGAVNGLSHACNLLRGISNVEEDCVDLAERLDSARLEVDDIAQTLEDILSKTEISQEEIDRLEGRLEYIRTIKRKYGGSIAEALKFLDDAKKQYDNLVNATERMANLLAEKTAIINKMYAVASKKSQIRKDTADKLAKRIMAELADLGMRGTTFVVDFAVQTVDEFAKMPSADGIDTVEFLMSANVGEPVKPLAKVISGGEMSRFMLAVKNITALAEKIPTMVFDEIDAGISGNVAQIVAGKLANVSSNKQEGYQCIVITHLPQICAMADTNMRIEKFEQDGKTHTSLTLLDESNKAQEVARLMGSIGEHALVSAQELITFANDYKKTIHA